ncbi:MAG: lyase [Crocinitomicaceae bacterium]|nr:lyase [Crocinitomicaceae bacterium]|tara:strand:- start:4786 stop:5202 length:417 start_codon:yes stop_codon:yes gene_type:complete
MSLKESNPFVNSELTTILVVSDLKASKSFYIETLGADLFREYGDDSVVIKFLGHWMLLVSSGGPTEDKPNIEFLPPQNREMVSRSFTIRVDDCQKSYEILNERGAEFITPPVTNGAETRCFFYDPDGHLFEISEYRAG